LIVKSETVKNVMEGGIKTEMLQTYQHLRFHVICNHGRVSLLLCISGLMHSGSNHLGATISLTTYMVNVVIKRGINLKTTKLTITPFIVLFVAREGGVGLLRCLWDERRWQVWERGHGI
jgi:hypothetical protein